MLAQAIKGQAELIGQFDLLEQVLETFRRALQPVAVQRVGRVFGKGVKSEFHRGDLMFGSQMAGMQGAIKNAHECNRDAHRWTVGGSWSDVVSRRRIGEG